VTSGQLGVTMLGSLSPFICILLAAFAGFCVAAEFDNGGARNSLALGKDRLHLYLAKQASVFAALAALLIVSAAGAILTGTVRFGFGDMQSDAYMSFLLTIFLLQLLYHLVYAAMFAAIAFITRNATMTVLLSIGWLIFEMILVSFLGRIGGFALTVRTVFPIYSVSGLYEAQQGLYGYANPAFVTRSIIAGIVSVILLIGVGAWAFRKAEIK
jgi:ABC-type transport system involved in multi-copper enzyme maturation permease subunit